LKPGDEQAAKQRERHEPQVVVRAADDHPRRERIRQRLIVTNLLGHDQPGVDARPDQPRQQQTRNLRVEERAGAHALGERAVEGVVQQQEHRQPQPTHDRQPIVVAGEGAADVERHDLEHRDDAQAFHVGEALGGLAAGYGRRA
jgi:hypothetical protein